MISAFYIERQLTLNRNGQIRKITQLQFTGWPDSEIPCSAGEILYFYYKVKALKRAGPLLVHCTDGVGRTGIFIALDNLLQQSEAKQEVNVYECVSEMRKDRCEMVHNVTQYQ